MFLVAADSHSKWLQVLIMNSTTAENTVTGLRKLFAAYGLPESMVSDNGPQFTSEEFEPFLKLNGVKHVLCPPYHPASNGFTERNVQTFKNMLAKPDPRILLQHRVSDILFQYRNTPHSITGPTPAGLFLMRAPRTRLTLLKPSLQTKIHDRQQKEKQHHDGSRPRHLSQFDIYQPVIIRNIRGGRERWNHGTVTKILLTYIVRLPGNNRHVIHVEHIIPGDDMLSGSPAPSPDSFSSGELLPANAALVLDKPSVPVELTRHPVVVQTPVRRSEHPAVSQSLATQDAPTGDLSLR
ncbi:hypothetical protein LSH36_240g02048 [Paralvinella palmiformis]|uniref:Integrase catalytic domain-containing protein n=1 Tax=Paralvinella palmiformis TaxID=53620 RepID=A0AAD9JLY5_9ANNE|nr:hypothetical protein LSH36_240g02048 [Paralvinella palmiformis]